MTVKPGNEQRTPAPLWQGSGRARPAMQRDGRVQSRHIERVTAENLRPND